MDHQVEDEFLEACARYKENPSRFSNYERLDVYGLYKQATSGDAPSEHIPAFATTLLKGAGYASWSKLAGVSKEEAMRRYVEMVGSESPGPSSSRRKVDEVTFTDLSEKLVKGSVEEMSREELVEYVEALRTQVRRLSVGHVVKEGELIRFRETMTGGDWSARWFEIVPGWLRCFKSRTQRILRLELSLTHVVGVHPLFVKNRFALEITLDAKTGESGSEHDTASSKLATLTRLLLSTSSREDRDEWIRAIGIARRAVAPSSPQTDDEDAANEEKNDGETTKGARSPPDGTTSSKEHAKTTAKHKSSPRVAVHRTLRPSILSADATEAQSFTGFVNLVGIIAVITNTRLLMNEWHLLPLFRNGIGSFTVDLGCQEVFWGALVVAGSVLASFYVERYAAAKAQDQSLQDLASKAHVLSCLASLVAPSFFVVMAPPRPSTHAAWLCASTVAWMKHVSWAHTNSSLRRSYARGENGDGASWSSHVVLYPNNLTLSDLARFFAFPTLIYQTSYPRTKRVRKRWLAKRIMELATVATLMILITTQFVAPTVEQVDLENSAFSQLFERLLALAIPNIVVWLLLFVAVFELWLSILAEITRFGDRLFYRDWWNSSKFDEYWRLWNLPVHNFLVRHVYYPALDLGLGRTGAMFCVFLFSASLHELLVSVPCHQVHFFVFFAMMAQIPLIALTNFIADKISPKSRTGNVLFWVTFCVVGQPVCIMLYSHQFFTLQRLQSEELRGQMAALGGNVNDTKALNYHATDEL